MWEAFAIITPLLGVAVGIYAIYLDIKLGNVTKQRDALLIEKTERSKTELLDYFYETNPGLTD